jgi:hypothetical protein
MAWAWRSWCGAKRRRTPARAASRRSIARAGCGLPRTPARRAVDDAEEWADGHGAAHGHPWFELFEPPIVHADLAPAAAFAAADEDRAAAAVEVELVEVQRFLDAQSGAPEDDNQRAGPGAVDRVVAAAHDGDDLLGPRWVGGEVAAPIRRPASCLTFRACDGRTARSRQIQRR